MWNHEDQPLKPLPAQLSLIADYAAYYLAAARVEAADYAAVSSDLVPVRKTSLASPLTARSWILEARSLNTTTRASCSTSCSPSGSTTSCRWR